jgi:RimJ/RimL family protein N-acetyltransferase
MTEALADSEIYRWTPLPRTSSVEQARAWIAKRLLQSETTQHEHFAIESGPADGLVGGFNVFFHDARRAEIGYFVLPAWRGKGLASAAARLGCEWAHGAGVERIEALIDVEHPVSARVVEGVGFRREGLLRHYRLQREVPRDMYVYGRLTSDPF